MFQPQPRWVVAGGCCLAFLSAAVNAVFLVQVGASVSHLSGDVSRVAVDAVSGGPALHGAIFNLLAATFGFLIGATTAGYYIHHPGLELSRPYGRSVIVISVSLLGAHFALDATPVLAVLLASFGCGLQNALATHYRGMVLRTTHVTGLLTDLGSTLGMRFKGHQIARWKLTVPACLVASFFLGAGVGAALLLHWRSAALLLLSLAYLAGGVGWTIYKHLWAQRQPADATPALPAAKLDAER